MKVKGYILLTENSKLYMCIYIYIIYVLERGERDILLSKRLYIIFPPLKYRLLGDLFP